MVEIPGIALEEVISRNIRLALLLRSKNQSDLARNFGVSPATISQKMHGIIAWTIADVSKASKFLNISPGKFLEPNGLLSLDSGDDYGEDGDDGGNGGDDLPPAGMGPRYLVQPFSPDLVGNSLICGKAQISFWRALSGEQSGTLILGIGRKPCRCWVCGFRYIESP